MSTALTTMPSYVNEMMPALTPELRDAFASHFIGAMENIGSGFNRVSLKGNRITLSLAGKDVRSEPDFLDVIIVGIAEKLHNQYYKTAFKDGNEGAPDAVWEYNTQAPPNVPASALVKDPVTDRYGFHTRRRIVCVAFSKPTPEKPARPDFDNLYVFDVNAKSLFGPDLDIPTFGLGKAHGFQSYLAFMKQCRVYPIAVPVRILMDKSESVPACKFIPWAQKGQLVCMDNAMLSTYLAPILQKPELAAMLDWRASAGGATQAQPAEAQAVAAQPTAPVNAPAYTPPPPTPAAATSAPADIYAQVAALTNAAPASVPPAADPGLAAMPDVSGFTDVTPAAPASVPPTPASTAPAGSATIPDVDENSLEAMLNDATATLSKV